MFEMNIIIHIAACMYLRRNEKCFSNYYYIKIRVSSIKPVAVFCSDAVGKSLFLFETTVMGNSLESSLLDDGL